MRALLFVNGPIADYNSLQSILRAYTYDCVVCCDGGARHADALGLRPDVLLGDFDSIDPALFARLQDSGVPCVAFPPAKDFTDMELAMQWLADRRACEVLVFGGLGDRFDHSLANTHILYQALQYGIHAVLYGEGTSIRLIAHSVTLSAKEGQLVSLLPLTETVTGVRTEGLLFPLQNETLRIGYGRGVSNRFTQETATVSVASGILIVICTLE